MALKSEKDKEARHGHIHSVDHQLTGSALEHLEAVSSGTGQRLTARARLIRACPSHDGRSGALELIRHTEYGVAAREEHTLRIVIAAVTARVDLVLARLHIAAVASVAGHSCETERRGCDVGLIGSARAIGGGVIVLIADEGALRVLLAFKLLRRVLAARIRRNANVQGIQQSAKGFVSITAIGRGGCRRISLRESDLQQWQQR